MTVPIAVVLGAGGAIGSACCKLNGVDPRAWLADILARIAEHPVFISHDLAVVEHLADRIAVMYLGRLVEIAPARRFAREAYHPYSRALLAAVPIPDPTRRRERKPLEGDMPSPLAPPSGCAFRTRCPFAREECANTVPSLQAIAPDHAHACLRDDLEPAAAPSSPRRPT
jgi:oligopeptide/dipeptide ABC transporter ATP-binding protein